MIAPMMPPPMRISRTSVHGLAKYRRLLSIRSWPHLFDCGFTRAELAWARTTARRLTRMPFAPGGRQGTSAAGRSQASARSHRRATSATRRALGETRRARALRRLKSATPVLLVAAVKSVEEQRWPFPASTGRDLLCPRTARGSP